MAGEAKAVQAKHLLAKESVPEELQELQDKEEPTEEDLDAELAAAKQAAAAMSKSGRLLCRSFGFRSKKALQPVHVDEEEEEEEGEGQSEGGLQTAPKTP